MLMLESLTCDGRKRPFGLPSALPAFCWKLNSDQRDTVQQNCRITVTDGKKLLWDTGIQNAAQSLYHTYQGEALQPHTIYHWRVTATDNHGERASGEDSFFSGKLSEPWQGRWIGSGQKNPSDNSLPPEQYRKTFHLDEAPVKAVLYVSALGIYEAEINRQKAGQRYFAPGYTHYRTQLEFQAYDVTGSLRSGENDLRIVVANDWYLGTIGAKNNNYGDHRGMIAELHIWCADGQHTVLPSDESWQWTTDTPLRYADFYNGQIIDVRKAKESCWQWHPVRLLDDVTQELAPDTGSQVTEEQRLELQELHFAGDEFVLDFGQNHAGVLHLTVDAPAGTCITVRHGELLNGDGTLFTDNLRSAKAEIVWYCGKDGIQECTPRFTFMGFRYASVRADRKIYLTDVESIVLTSEAEPIGSFSCSDPLLSRFQQNIQWSQRSNFIEIPTDCPQRDERMGWTGDIAVFAQTAASNRDVRLFMRKWLGILRRDQRANGTIPVTVPQNSTYDADKGDIPIAIWGDAAVMVPWAVYQAYGDLSMLEEQYDSMKRYVEAERRAAAQSGTGDQQYLWDNNPFQYGDWCAPGESWEDWMAKGKWLATAYFANSVSILQKAASVLGKASEAEEYAALHDKICAAFTNAYLNPDGTLTAPFQSNYVCALYFGLLPEDRRAAAAEQLVRLVRAKQHRIQTGFAGTPYIAFVLADCGYVEDAYRLIQSTFCPSWLYTVKAGGTTVWERWDALDEENGAFYQGSGADMVSFNYYAYGAVGDFYYRRILGIEPIETGYRAFRIRPVIGGTLTHAEGSIETPYGRIESRWQRADGVTQLDITVPCGTRCQVILPDGTEQAVGSGSYQYMTKIVKKEEL